MVRRDMIKRRLAALEAEIPELERYTTSIARERYDEEPDDRRLAEYAVFRVLTLSLDLVKEWAVSASSRSGTPTYFEGFEAMERDGAVESEVAMAVRDLVELRNSLAHASRGFEHDLVFDVLQSPDLFRALADGVERFLRAAVERLHEGAILTGSVTRIESFGAFIDLGEGFRGLLHVSAMSSSWVAHPRDLLTQGEEVRVMVISSDAEGERVRLRLVEEKVEKEDGHAA